MTCAEIDELSGAIALDAIPDDEWPAIREHLATCPTGHPDLRELQAVAALLLEAAPPMAPPAGLRGRILAAARAEVDGAPDSPPLLTAAAPIVTGATEVTEHRVVRRTDKRWWRRPGWVAAAAAVVVAAALGLWALSLQRDLDSTRDRLTTAEERLGVEQWALAIVAAGGTQYPFSAAVPNAAGRVLRPAAGTATLVVQGLTPTDGTTYQVWALRGGQPVSIGVFEVVDNGPIVVSLDHTLQDVDAVAITLEPGPRGSAAPTSSPVLVAPLGG